MSRVGRDPGESPDELAALWRRFKASGARDARDLLLIHYSPLVKFVASRVAAGLPSSVMQEDLISYGMFGLIDALDKFDLARGIKFETYGIPRIRGAIIDELRSLDWVPRTMRTKAREFEKAYDALEAEFGRAPTEPELASRLRLSPQGLHDLIREISSLTMIALDEPVSGTDRGETVALIDTLPDRAGDLMSGLEGNETRAMLAGAINSLTDREKIVITLYYFEGLTLAEIGEVLGVTESRVCQIHTKAVARLRERLSDQEE
jgi:RNA polymerase sigma factor for flagellar operon FliA